jgi:hypothetical protein
MLLIGPRSADGRHAVEPGRGLDLSFGRKDSNKDPKARVAFHEHSEVLARRPAFRGFDTTNDRRPPTFKAARD